MSNTVTASVERLMGNQGKSQQVIAGSGAALAATLLPTFQKMPGGPQRLSPQIKTSEGIVTALKQVLTDHGIREADAIALEMLAVLEVGLTYAADPTLDITGGAAPVQTTEH